jgi:hypothetical protein
MDVGNSDRWHICTRVNDVYDVDKVRKNYFQTVSDARRTLLLI